MNTSQRFISNLIIEFDGFLHSNHLHFNCVSDFNKKQLITNSKILPPFKVTADNWTNDSATGYRS